MSRLSQMSHLSMLSMMVIAGRADGQTNAPPSTPGDGVAVFKLSFDARGAITDCVITRSSGYANLDADTCQMVRKGSPTRDPGAGGEETTSIISSVRWQVPQR